MPRSFNAHLRSIAICLLALFIIDNAALNAFAATFTIDSNLSALTATVTIGGGSPLSPQLPGSLTAQIQGTFEADVTGGSLQLPGGWNLDFIEQLGPFNPGAAPADFAASTIFVVATLRGGALDLVGGPTPIVGTNFAANATATFLAGLVQVGGIFGSASENITGLSFLSTPAALGSFSQSGSTSTLQIPIDFTAFYPEVGVTVRFVGQVVGTTTVPEASTFFLSAIGSLSVAAYGWRRKR
ncbi:hypothetical protein K2X85_07925 [bacterium]|nr:hypothetical protein [bacterium]